MEFFRQIAQRHLAGGGAAMSLDLAPYGAGGGVYIEIGTREGAGVLAALRAGFREIHSVEPDEAVYQNAMAIIGAEPDLLNHGANLCLYHGDKSHGLALLGEKFRHRSAHLAFHLAAYDFDVGLLHQDLVVMRRIFSGILRQPPVFLFAATDLPAPDWPDYRISRSAALLSLIPDWWQKSSELPGQKADRRE